MGKYDDITPERLSAELRRFARLVSRWDEQGVLLDETPSLQQFLGELRRMLFAYEVRCTRKLEPPMAADPGATQPDPDQSSRIVTEALDLERQLHQELQRRLWSADDGGEG